MFKKKVVVPPPPEAMSFTPSDYLGTDEALIAILVSLLVLYPPTINSKFIMSGAVGYGAWAAAAASWRYQQLNNYLMKTGYNNGCAFGVQRAGTSRK